MKRIILIVIALLLFLAACGNSDYVEGENFTIVDKKYNENTNALDLRILINDTNEAEEIAEYIANEYTGLIELNDGETPVAVNGIFIYANENEEGEAGKHIGTGKLAGTKSNAGILGVEETNTFYFEEK